MKTKLFLFATSFFLTRKLVNYKPKITFDTTLSYKRCTLNTLNCSSELSRPYFGCSIRTNESGVGMIVVMVKSDSPAELCGIRIKDVILEIDGKPINTIHDYNGAVGSEKGKKKVKIMRKVENQEKCLEIYVDFIK